MSCSLPEDAIVVINKFTDRPLFSSWDFVFEQLTGQRPERSVVQPGLKDVKTALGNRRLVLIFDELEQGIRVISDDAIKAQNLAFLQVLSEWAMNEDKVTLFASIYSDQQEPGETLKRVPNCRVRFEQATDKARIVLHRMFEKSADLSPEQVHSVTESFLGAWRRQSAIPDDDYSARFNGCFPFSPDLLKAILEEIPSRGGFQNVRGALGFLARIVKLTHLKTDLITAAHCSLQDQGVRVRLADLDASGDLVKKAVGNLNELSRYPLILELGSATMLYNVVPKWL